MQTVYQLALSATIFVVLLTGGVLSPRVATAAIYYVATTGSDSNSCSQSTPCRTIARGMSVLRSGDTLYIREGTYAESIGSSAPVPSGTSWSNAVTIAGYPGETVILSGYHTGISLNDGTHVSYVIFDNLIIDASGGNSGIFIGCDSHHIRFMNGEVKDSPDGVLVFGCGAYVEVLDSKIHGAFYYGFYWLGHDSIFDGNEVYDNGGYAYHIYHSGASDVNNNIISNNIVHGNGFNGGNGAGGIILSSGSNNRADNNTVYGNYSGISVDYTHGGTNNQVSNNTIYGNTSSGIHIGAGALNTIVQNNTVYQNGIDIIDDGVGTGTILIDADDGEPQDPRADDQ